MGKLHHEIGNGGVAAMASDLMKMDLTGFNVRDKPNTSELLGQKLNSLDHILRWWYNCLVQGELHEGEGWNDFISTLQIIANVVETTGGKILKKPMPVDVIKIMADLCPSATMDQHKTTYGRRARGLCLPPLEQARHPRAAVS